MDNFDSYALFLLVVIPMAGAVVVMLIPGALKQQIRWVSSAFALSALLVSFYVFWAYDHEAGGFQFQRTWDWLAMPGTGPLSDKAITGARHRWKRGAYDTANRHRDVHRRSNILEDC